MNLGRTIVAAAFVAVGLMSTTTTAVAQPPESAVAQPPENGTASEESGINVDLGFASAYVFRGWNMFQKDSQMDPHMLLAPGLSWSIGDSGVTLAYWSAYQLTGTNMGANTDGALNAEQDLIVTYDLELPKDLGLSLGLAAYLFPAADPNVMGSSMPVYLDPVVALSYATALDLRLAVSYFVGLQDEPYIWGISYLYINPAIAKSLELSDHVGVDLSLGYGLKVPNEGMEGRDNIHDVTLTAGLPIHPGGPGAYVTPGLGLAWTNVEDGTDEESGAVIDERGFGEGFVLWASLNLGLDM